MTIGGKCVARTCFIYSQFEEKKRKSHANVASAAPIQKNHDQLQSPELASDEAAMAKAYWIATYRSIKNPEALDAYAKLAGPAIVLGDGAVRDIRIVEGVD